MSENSKIQWTDDTMNFWRGCVKVSPGCAHCYAEVSTPVRVARSEGRELWGGRLRDRAKDFEAPLRWNAKPWVCDGCGVAQASIISSLPPCLCLKCTSKSFHRRRVFSLSLGDWLDPDVPIEWLADMLDVIRRCPNLDFLLLTKRPENFESRLSDAFRFWTNTKTMPGGAWESSEAGELYKWIADWVACKDAPQNVWIGTTVENQEYADKRIPELLKIPARVRFLSVEPLLGPVDLKLTKAMPLHDDEFGDQHEYYEVNRGISWTIIGGESGPHARPFNVKWARSVVIQCQAADVPVFVKQLGSKYEDEENGVCGHGVKWPFDMLPHGPTYRLKDHKGGDISEFPADLRVREFPRQILNNPQSKSL